MQDSLPVKTVTKVIGLESVDSTQNVAKELALAGEPEGTLVLACTQTSGRGRYDRRFDSGHGGVYFTLILRPQKLAACNASLSVRAGEAVADTITALFGLKTKIKLPNDVLVWDSARRQWKKVCGILIETSALDSSDEWVLVGIGVNVNNSLSPALRQTATSLKQLLGKKIDKEMFLEELLERFWKHYTYWLMSCR